MGYRYEEKEEERRCVQCGTPIDYGRRDKKFCCPECKNQYHNRAMHLVTKQQRKAEDALLRNHGLLDALMHLRIEEARLEDLVAIGFRPEYFSGLRSEGGTELVCCYDISYRLSDGMVSRIRQDGVLPDELERKMHIFVPGKKKDGR